MQSLKDILLLFTLGVHCLRQFLKVLFDFLKIHISTNICIILTTTNCFSIINIDLIDLCQSLMSLNIQWMFYHHHHEENIIRRQFSKKPFSFSLKDYFFVEYKNNIHFVFLLLYYIRTKWRKPITLLSHFINNLSQLQKQHQHK